MSLSADMSRIAEELHASYNSRISAVDALQAATSQQIAELHTQHQAMASAQRQQLQQSAEARRQAVTTLLHDLQVERAALSADQQRRLEAYTSNLRQTTNQRLAEQAAAHKAMSASQRQRLDAYTRDLQQRTDDSLARAHAVRQAIHNDHAAAHKAWQQFNDEMRRQRADHSRHATPHQ
ncbi:MAG: hypothetical protein HGA45_04875 [Chloroflexales bacterium]|nr:hypothetical protein [Chloroflexales bacterium]